MSKAFTSGENTADVQAEKKINKNGLWIFVAILVFALLAFIIWATMFMSGRQDGGTQRPQTESNRAQP